MPAFRYGHCNFKPWEALLSFAILIRGVNGAAPAGIENLLSDPADREAFLRAARQAGLVPAPRPAPPRPLSGARNRAPRCLDSPRWVRYSRARMRRKPAISVKATTRILISLGLTVFFLWLFLRKFPLCRRLDEPARREHDAASSPPSCSTCWPIPCVPGAGAISWRRFASASVSTT